MHLARHPMHFWCNRKVCNFFVFTAVVVHEQEPKLHLCRPRSNSHSKTSINFFVHSFFFASCKFAIFVNLMVPFCRFANALSEHQWIISNLDGRRHRLNIQLIIQNSSELTPQQTRHYVIIPFKIEAKKKQRQTHWSSRKSKQSKKKWNHFFRTQRET